MDAFKKMLNSRDFDNISLSKAEAFAAIGVCALAADNLLVPDEMEHLLLLLSEIPLFKGYSQQRKNKMLNFLLELVRRKGIETTIVKAKDTLPPELRSAAFQVARDIIWSDGEYHPSEEAFLQHLREVLELPEEPDS